MTEPPASAPGATPPRAQRHRPAMPGYGVRVTADGMLPWAWAQERLTRSRTYWVATVRPDGRPHLMPVWGVWAGGRLVFSSGLRSRKVRNLVGEPRVAVATDQGDEPVVVEGAAALLAAEDDRRAFLAALNVKYDTAYGAALVDPAVNATVAVTPRWVFALDDTAFESSPTAWTFPGDARA